MQDEVVLAGSVHAELWSLPGPVVIFTIPSGSLGILEKRRL